MKRLLMAMVIIAILFMSTVSAFYQPDREYFSRKDHTYSSTDYIRNDFYGRTHYSEEFEFKHEISYEREDYVPSWRIRERQPYYKSRYDSYRPSRYNYRDFDYPTRISYYDRYDY